MLLLLALLAMPAMARGQELPFDHLLPKPSVEADGDAPPEDGEAAGPSAGGEGGEGGEGAAGEGAGDEAPSGPIEPQIFFDVPEAVAFSNRVLAVEVLCDVPYCDSLEHVQALERVTGMWPGQLFSTDRVKLAQRRLEKTGYFARVDARISTEADGVRVSFEALGQAIVGAVDFEDTGALFAYEIEKRMFLRPGRPFTPRLATLRKLPDASTLSQAELDAIALEDQRAAILRLYEDEGYYAAEVELVASEIEPYLVRLDIDVDQGRPYVLGRLYVRGADKLGVDRIDESLRGAFGFFSNCTVEQIEKGVQAVVELYRREGYLHARVDWDCRRVDPSADGPSQGYFDVYLEIDEGKRWNIVVEGNAVLDTEEILDAMTFFEVGYVDESEIEASIARILALYETVGHYWAMAEEVAERRSESDTEATRVFVIEEGPRAEIERIVFDGASAIPEDELLATIRSQPYQAFGSGAYPQLSLIADDAGLIVEAYRQRGYLRADVGSWSIKRGEEPAKVTLTFFIDEGPRSSIGAVHVSSQGDPVPDETLARLATQPGDALSFEDIRADQTRLVKPYRGMGHALVAVGARCLPHEATAATELPEAWYACEAPELPGECFPADPKELCSPAENGQICTRHYRFANNDPEDLPCDVGPAPDAVDVFFSIEPGQKHYVGDFFLHGNFVTADWVVLQDFPFEPADPFDYNKLLDARSRLRSRTIYESVTVETIGLEDDLQRREGDERLGDTSLSDVPLVISIEEASRRWLDLALGSSYVSAEWLATAEIEYVEANVLGAGWEWRLLFLPEFRFLNENGEFVLTKGFNQNWFLLSTFQVPLSPISGIDLLLQLFYDLRYIPSTWREEQGAVAELRWDISRRWFASLALEGKLSATHGVTEEIEGYDPCAPFTYFQDCPFDERFQTYSLIPRVLYDGRNSPLNPTRGYYFEARTKVAYSEEAGAFVKPDVRFSTYWHFLRNFTLGWNMRLGLSFLGEGDELPLVERYFLGGINVRGFEIDALGPRRIDPDNVGSPTNEAAGGEFLLNTSLELRFPILKDTGIHGVVFWDTGSLLTQQPLAYAAADTFFADVFWHELRHTAGLGLRWLIADNLPPIVLDYGIVLDRRLGEPFGGLHLNVGYAF